MFNQKGSVPILVLLVFTLLAGFVIYQKQTTSPAPKPSEQPKVVDETTDWKTYIATDFTISYPPDWKITDQLQLYKAQYDNKLPPELYWLNNTTMYIIISQKSPPALVGIRVTTDTPSEIKKQNFTYDILKVNQAKSYLLQVDAAGEKNALTDQILSTFKFTDSITQNHILLPKQDLAKKLGVKEEDITVVNVEETEWNDSSLGCPKEGMFYTQVITPGYKVILSYNHPLAEFQKTYEYHTDKKGNFVFCEP